MRRLDEKIIMESSSSKESILKNIRKALTQPTEQPYPALDKAEFNFEETGEDLAVLFAEKFTALLNTIDPVLATSNSHLVMDASLSASDLVENC